MASPPGPARKSSKGTGFTARATASAALVSSATRYAFWRSLARSASRASTCASTRLDASARYAEDVVEKMR